MVKEELFEVIDSLKDKYVKFLSDVCEIESPTEYKPGVDAVGRYFIDRAKEIGFDTEVFPQPVSGDVVCITMNSDINEKPLCLSGHMDTVHPLGFFGEPTVRIEGDKMYGPGVNDCKGGIVIGLMTMEALLRVGYRKRPVMLLLQSDEENSSKTSDKATINYICEKAKGAVLFLNLEPSNGKIVFQRKGILKYTFNVKGTAIHASQCFKDSCASAILEACHKIIELEKLKDESGITCSCGLISGGTAVNTVPSNCTFSVDVRFPDDERLKQAHLIMQKVADTSYIKGTSCELILNSKRVAMPYEKRNYDAYDFVNQVFRKYGLGELDKEIRCGGSDAADVSVAGIPCLDALGIAGGEGHKITEFSYLSSMPLFAKRLAAIAEEI